MHGGRSDNANRELVRPNIGEGSDWQLSKKNARPHILIH
jgi:hypothetical protein